VKEKERRGARFVEEEAHCLSLACPHLKHACRVP